MKTTENTEEVSSDGMEKREERRNWRQIAPCSSEKPMADLKKVLANLWSRKKIKKKPHAGRGQETKWEIPIYPDYYLSMNLKNFKLRRFGVPKLFFGTRQFEAVQTKQH